MGDWLAFREPHNRFFGKGVSKCDHVCMLGWLAAAIFLTSLQFLPCWNEWAGLEHLDHFEGEWVDDGTHSFWRQLMSGFGGVCGAFSGLYALIVKTNECAYCANTDSNFSCDKCGGKKTAFDWRDFAFYVFAFVGFWCVCANGFLHYSSPAKPWVAVVGYVIFGTGLICLMGKGLKAKCSANKRRGFTINLDELGAEQIREEELQEEEIRRAKYKAAKAKMERLNDSQNPNGYKGPGFTPPVHGQQGLGCPPIGEQSPQDSGRGHRGPGFSDCGDSNRNEGEEGVEPLPPLQLPAPMNSHEGCTIGNRL